MNVLRIVIVVGQVGRIWSKSAITKNIFQTMSALGYFSLMTDFYDSPRSQIFNIEEQEAEVTIISSKQQKIKPLKFKRKPY